MMASWVEKGKGGVELKVIERTEGSYEVQDAPFGKVYKWCPENVVVKCECGERLALTSLETTCGRCGIDHGPTVQKELDAHQLEDETRYPWRHAGDREDTGIPY